MPKEILRDPLYACTICDTEHPSFDLALKCEQRGVKPFRFHRFQVVTCKARGNIKHGAVVHSPWGDQEKIEPHEYPSKYLLRMEFPSLRNEKTRRIFDWGDVYTDNISAKCHRALTCPLCHSKEVTVENDFYSANLLYAQYFLLENIVHTECKSCKTEFFTQDQLKVMLAEMAKAQAEAQEKVAELTQ